MNKIALLAGAVALTTFALPAAAADFVGPRVEAHVGLDRLNTKGAATGTDHHDGLMYGGGAGWDFALGSKLIVGVEANLDFSDVKDSIVGTVSTDSFKT